MFENLVNADKSGLPKIRRADLRVRTKETYSHVKQGIILLCAGFEQERISFRQESSFYYLTGITEPGLIMLIDLAGKTILYVPGFENRSAWLKSQVEEIQANPKAWDIDEVRILGKIVQGYQIHPFTSAPAYEQLIAQLSQYSAQGFTLFTLNPENPHEYVEQRIFLQRLLSWVPGFAQQIQDISEIVAQMRRSKDMSEIESLYKAVEVTSLAQEAVANILAPGVNEAEVQATAEYMMIGSQARVAFPSIIGGGINSTILHYHANNQVLNAGDVVVVDIGAEMEYYCADITRTYPVSGVFSPRQKELYNIVLETQEYIAEIAKPGMWLRNQEKPAQSLHHRAVEFLEKRGYSKYFIHGIGHFLGLDVHDVGNRNDPLEEGDVFTIEPGIYIAAEKIGIRIEDDYWMTKDGVVCLSEELPKEAEEIEQLVQQKNEQLLQSPAELLNDEREIAES
jgi:Xaa-Pro aminopeptidase